MLLPAADLLPATTKTTFKSDILRLETSLESDYYPFKSIIPLLETALDDKPNDHDIWHRAWEAVVNESGRSQKFGSHTEYASNVDGRQYLLRELPNVEQTYDRETWTRMTRDLFHNLDRPLFDVRAVFVTFLNWGREGQHRWGYVFGVATTTFHPPYLVHVSIHFKNRHFKKQVESQV